MSKLQAPSTLADVVRSQAIIRKDAIAFEFEGRKTSFVAADTNSNRVANGLIALGIEPNERIAYLGKNSDTFFEVWFGAIKANVVLVPINWRLAAAEIALIADDCKATILFVGPEFVELVRGIKSRLPGIRTFITLAGGAPEWTELAAWLDEQSSDDPKLPTSEQGVAIQLYTSGTTGRPKGAMLSHANFLSNFQSWRGTAQATEWRWNIVTSDDVLLLPLPLFHIAGISLGMLNFFHGGEIIITREFDADNILDLLAISRVTRVFLVPAAMQMMVRLPRSQAMKFASLRYMFYGASPIPAALLKECIAVFNCSFVQIFGMTETTGVVTALPPEDHVEGLERMRSAGKPLPGIELAIVDADGKQLPPEGVGEIVARSGSNMVGYWNFPEATAQAIDADGWLHTGDAGYLDLDGYLYVHDRIKNMIISGGENIYPAEIESVICDHPDVIEAAVIGIPDETWGEAVKAIVVLKPGKTTEAADIIGFTRKRVASFKAPKSIDFIEALPRNGSGKILHRNLRERYWSGRDRQVN
jgi:acyl-CoA synthetase (AMP-forming)/AMP-acid ligase II